MNTLPNQFLRNLLVSITGLCLLILSTPLWANTNMQMAEELTTLFRSARAVISQNQNHINNPNLGNKGLSGQSVVEKALTIYQKNVGKPLDINAGSPEAVQAKKAMIAAIKQTMASAQPIINEKGKGFKGFLPAVFAKQVADNFSKTMKGKMSIKLTAPKEYLRNRANRPDQWERQVISDKFRQPGYKIGKPFTEQTTAKGKPAFRYILPEYYGKSCLSCHGEPKGGKDITGGTKEGGKLGELGGAISLVIYD